MKEDVIELDGTVTEVSGSHYRVKLDQGAMALTYLSGRMKRNRIRVIAGDRVKVEMTPYDLTRGRINFRHKEERASGAPASRPPMRRR